MTSTNGPGTPMGASLASDVLDQLGLRDQCLGWDITPMCGLPRGRVVVGTAFPFTVEPVDAIPEVPYVGLLAALDAVGGGDVVVVPTGRDNATAVWGELLSTSCRARNAAGVVTDGLVRDVHEVDDLGFPVFARGTVPTDVNGRLEVVGHGAAVEIDGVAIAPGDLIVADADGVVVVPAAHAEEVAARVAEKAAGENAFKRAVAEGMQPSEAYRRFGVL